MKKSVKGICFILSIIIVIGASLIFLTPIYFVLMAYLFLPTIYSIAMLGSTLFLTGFSIYIVYKYLLTIIALFQEKKKLKPIIMIAFILLVAIIATVIRLEANTFLATVLIPFLYIVGIIAIPIIMLGIILLGKSENRKRKIISAIILIVITLGIYGIHYPYLTTATREVMNNIQDFFVSKGETANSEEYNLIYLENYKQKMESEGYLDKYDVETILKIVDSRTDNIIVHYNDGKEEFEYNNVDNQLIEELGSKLEGDFYKFQYTHKNEQTDIYIEKY